MSNKRNVDETAAFEAKRSKVDTEQEALSTLQNVDIKKINVL